MTHPLRKVVLSTPCGASRYTGYQHKSINLKLECGHELYRKASAGTPKTARCRDCGLGRTPDR
jgi:hypothetical protein